MARLQSTRAKHPRLERAVNAAHKADDLAEPEEGEKPAS